MNHLRELLDQGRSVGVLPDYPQELLDARFAWLHRYATEAMCFFCGDARQWTTKVDDELCKLPFDVCWFEFDTSFQDHGSLFGLLVVQRGDEVFVDIYTKMSRQWIWALSAAVVDGVVVADERFFMKHGDLKKRTWDMTFRHLKRFLCALNCTNVNRIEHAPSEKLQAARRKRGKQPLFSYWTLHLGTRSASGEWLGGTHASPRVHLRRGHRRQYAPGKFTWVQPHAVGNKSLGMVHKDYDGSALVEVSR